MFASTVRFGRLGAPAGRSLESAVRALFSDGQQGFWYDSQDLSTLFQDSAGTTPCTMPGQGVAMPVGLQLDKRLGLVLGSELVTNGDFATDTWWSKGGGCTIDGGFGVASSAANTSGWYRLLLTTVGKYYEITFTVVSCSSGGFAASFFTTNRSATYSTPGTYKVRLLADGTTFGIITVGASTTGTIDNVSLKEVSGNHRFQTGSTSRAQLSARVNQLLYSEDFTNGVWTKENCTINAAGLMTDNSTNGEHRVYYNVGSSVIGVSQSIYIEAKAGTASFIGVSSNGISPTVFNLSNGTVAVAGVGTASIELLSDGYYRCRVVNRSWPGVYFIVNMGTTAAQATSGTSYVGNGSTVFIRKADLRAANESASLPPYQRVVDSLTYDTAGFPLFIAPDGSDDWMQTNSIDFSGSDKVFVAAGVRKLSDAARGMLIEFNTGSGAGTFNISAPGSAAANYSAGSGGSVFVGPITSASSYAAPLSNVLTGKFVIGSDTLEVYANGVLALSANTDQGTGNFGNYPAYFYRRAGTSLPANVRDYGMVCRGGTLPTDAQIVQVERWLAQKTGVVLA
jgi:hypothetical protein